ncbi:MAG TPA: EscU/YscU/HrcU family type III secretion system export apparatus switch protein [Mycobacterium sp.]|nr:EscU/YscU/HrcU family type III secretion system export apparatus switch protein [Mycobacterium sp.]
MAGKPAEERTEKATPRKRKKARREGQIGNSPEIGSWLGLLAASFVVPNVMRSLMHTASTTLIQAGSVIDSPDIGRAMVITREAFLHATLSLAPLALLILGIGVGSVALQGGISVAPKLVMPKFSRINPLSGFKRMFGAQAGWSLVKAIVKSAALGLVAYASVRTLVPTLMTAGSLQISALLSVAVDAVLRLLRWCAAAGLVMAFGDYAVVRRRNNKSLKMTKQELKEEMKSTDGNPQLRSAIRSRAMAISRNRMMADVPKADVVVVNPTHVAVALRYEASRGAPRVVAKGGDHMAARIRAIAQQHRIPMVEDVPLARTLYQAVEVGREIPDDMFEAVARVLAFIMMLKTRGSVAGTHKVGTLARR